MQALIALAVRRRVSVVMFALAIIAFGVVGYQRLAVELFPDIAYPSLTVQTNFPDAAPQEVETMVTRLVEEAVGVLPGLTRIHSVSRPSVSEVSLEFDWGSDMGSLAMDVREKLDRVVLPEEAEDPIVLRFDPSLDPIVRVALLGNDPLTAVRTLAERKLKPDLETVPGVAAAQLRGGLEEEIRIEIDQERLSALSIPLEQVHQAVGGSNVNLPGGALRGEDRQFLIRTLNELDSVSEVAQLIVREEEGRVVTLGDVANVYRGAREREEITRVDGEESVEVAIFKEGDANTVTVARALEERFASWNKKLPPGYRLVLLFDQSRFIEQAVKEVRDATIIGGLLAILVLFVFLREFWSTIIVVTSIPLSVVATFVVMYRLDVSLNIMSLGGLTLGIGMLVDNAIVVLESIHRHRHSGLKRKEAAIAGASDVGAAVTASTLTSIAVFLPIVFVEGVAGQLFEDQAITVAVSLAASLLVALTVIPMLSARGKESTTHGEKVLGRWSERYERALRFSLKHRCTTLILAFSLFGCALWAGGALETELIPKLSSGEFHFELKMPEGTALLATDRIVTQMEQAADDQRIERRYATVGSRQVAGGMSVNTKAENFGQLNVVLKDRDDPVLEAEVAAALRKRYADIPDAIVRLGQPTYFSFETPVELAVFGDDLDALRTYSLLLAQRIAEREGFVDVRASLEAGNPELQIVFDRRRVAALGYDLATLSETLRSRVQGAVPTRFKEADRQIDIRVLNQAQTRTSVEDVRRLILPRPDARPGTEARALRLLSVAEVRPAKGPAEIHRLQQQRAALITANLDGLGLSTAVTEVEQILQALPPGSGMTTEIGGQSREMEVSFESLRFAIALAIFLVYLVMASTFESLIHPFLVLFTIPLALVGVVAGLLVTGTTVTVIVFIGAIMLVGIVVNNAIVLIDAINRLRRSGADKLEAVVRAGCMRLRPILMTTLTTSLALVPMALGWGEGGELRAPLAIAVASGLLFSTLLTLVVIPVLYLLVPSRVEEE